MRTLFVFLLLIVTGCVLLFAMSATPAITLPASVTAIGQSTPVSVQVSDPHGVREVALRIEQNGEVFTAGEAHQPSRRIRWQKNVPDGS